MNTRPIGDAGYSEGASINDYSVEYLGELQGASGSVRLRQMAKSDPIASMMLRVHKNPILSASWDIDLPDDATDQEKIISDIIVDILFGGSGSKWDLLLSQILTMMEYGFSLFERYYTPYRYNGNLYMVPTIEQRMPVSVSEILFDDKKIRQWTNKKGTVDISFDDLIFFTLNQQGNDLRGESLLRGAYTCYKHKRAYKEWLGIGIQRSATGIPSMEVPKDCAVDSADYLAVEALLKNITAHEEAYMIFKEGYKFNVFDLKFNSDAVQKAIDNCNTEMALSVLAQFVMLGQMGNGGAYALSRDQSDYFLDGLAYIISYICGKVNNEFIDKFIDVNFQDTVESGRIKLTGRNLNKKAGIELANTLNTLKGSGFLRPTTQDEIMLRNNLEMPELTLEDLALREELINSPATVPPSPPVKLSEKSERTARQKYIDAANKEMADFMQANLMLMKDRLLANVEAVLNRGTVEIQGLKNIDVSSAKYLKGLQMKLAAIAQESWTRAKKSAKVNSVKLAELDPKKIASKPLLQFVLNQSVGIVDKQSAAMLNRAIMTASTGPLKGLSVEQTMLNVDKAIDEYISSSGVIVDGSLIVVGTANFGEKQFYDEIKDELWGYRFVAVDDDVTSEICQWYNGKTFSVNSPEMSIAAPPLHPNCRSYLEPIYKSEDQVDIDDVVAPPSVMEGKTIF